MSQDREFGEQELDMFHISLIMIHGRPFSRSCELGFGAILFTLRKFLLLLEPISSERAAL